VDADIVVFDPAAIADKTTYEDANPPYARRVSAFAYAPDRYRCGNPMFEWIWREDSWRRTCRREPRSAVAICWRLLGHCVPRNDSCSRSVFKVDFAEAITEKE
jgi:hypothetical protein